MMCTGWIKVLSEWVNSKDLLLSVLAGQCLINLDRDDHTQSHYGRNVVPLHPLHRSHAPLLDVVFVHGLLGGVLTTWRQRDSSKNVNIGIKIKTLYNNSNVVTALLVYLIFSTGFSFWSWCTTKMHFMNCLLLKKISRFFFFRNRT